MNERYVQLFKKMGQRLDLVAAAALLIMLIIICYIVLVWEKQATIAEIPNPPAFEWEVFIPSPEYDLVMNAYADGKPPLNQDEALRTLIQTDMFSIKAVRETEQARSRTGEDLRRAEQALRTGNLDEAEAIVNNVLAGEPGNREAENLKQRIETARTQEPAPDG